MRTRSRFFAIASLALLYFIIYEVAIIPLMKTSAEPNALWPDFTLLNWVVYIAYIPPIATAGALSCIQAPLFMDGPNVPGTWAVVICFGMLWGTLLFLIGKGFADLFRKTTQQNFPRYGSKLAARES